jgi:proteic killer suppression protein
MAVKLHMRIKQLQAVESIDELISLHRGRCHQLVGDRKGEYALDLVHPQRLIFTKREPTEREQADGSRLTIQVVRIEDIVDYH